LKKGYFLLTSESKTQPGFGQGEQALTERNRNQCRVRFGYVQRTFRKPFRLKQEAEFKIASFTYWRYLHYAVPLVEQTFLKNGQRNRRMKFADPSTVSQAEYPINV